MKFLIRSYIMHHLLLLSSLNNTSQTSSSGPYIVFFWLRSVFIVLIHYDLFVLCLHKWRPVVCLFVALVFLLQPRDSEICVCTWSSTSFFLLARAVLSRRTFCDAAAVPSLCCPTQWPLATCGLDHLKCGWCD